jgi:hypothetical protein
MINVFFYGLFMDADLLTGKGLKPTASTVVVLPGYGLRIGERATLVHSPHEKSFGTIIGLNTTELDRLYTEAGVQDYLPENVVVYDLDDNPIDAVVYILPAQLLTGKNTAYARKLAAVARKLGLPKEYVDEIIKWCE